MSGCRCGSGMHPRRCEIHPHRYQQHCDEISVENLLDDVARLKRERDELLEALKEAVPIARRVSAEPLAGRWAALIARIESE